MLSASFFKQRILTPNQFIGSFKDIKLYIKREDTIHPIVSGNKFRKLKYNLLEAQKQSASKILTFGGAYSNHIAATAEACSILGLESIGIIRGEELENDLQKTLSQNPTLGFAHQKGMKFHFVSRTDFRQKDELSLVERLLHKNQSTYIIPEGGTNALAIKGCKEILDSKNNFDIICSSVGTGGTIAGLIEASKSSQYCIGFSALKGDFLIDDIARWTSRTNWMLQTDYSFGGYAKVNSDLISFINWFKKSYKIQLDPVYTGKMLYGIFELISAGYFSKNTRILAVHTGGLQGIEGMNRVLKQKGKTLIN